MRVCLYVADVMLVVYSCAAPAKMNRPGAINTQLPADGRLRGEGLSVPVPDGFYI